MNHRHELIKFAGHSAQLSATLHVPNGPIKGGVVQTHCFTCSRSLKVTRYLASGIEVGGYAVLRFDFTGLGESEGDFGDTNVTTNIQDVVRAADYLEKRNFGPCALVGHSLGGAAVLLAADELPDVRAVVAVAAPFNTDHVRHLFTEDDVQAALASGRAEIKIAGRSFAISAEFFRDLERHCSPERIAALARPLLVVHGPPDAIVPIAEGERIFAAARQPRWFAAIPGADHLFSSQRHAEQAAGAIVQFLDTVMV